MAPFSATSNPAIAHTLARSFYMLLQKEVQSGNPYLSKKEQENLGSHYPHMMNSRGYPPELVATIYARRRAHPLQALCEFDKPMVFDAGCGFGSDSFLFASLGARVLAVDSSAEQVTIGQKRNRYYEGVLAKSLDVTFIAADLNEYSPEIKNFSLTWLASILAVIRNQEGFLERIFHATRPGGRVLVMDYNLLHPPFLWNEWLRRRRAILKSPEFARRADYWGMVGRRERDGARFFSSDGGNLFDDVQFFTPGTLTSLLQKVGFHVLPPLFTGCAIPLLGRLSVPLEQMLSRLPGWKSLGRAYLITGVKQ